MTNIKDLNKENTVQKNIEFILKDASEKDLSIFSHFMLIGKVKGTNTVAIWNTNMNNLERLGMLELTKLVIHNHVEN